ncbi:S4 domain-containing protein [Brassicibacter mesophilus]|uniref:S4 domain-containing protein n=1 Tax=Brassicibacter mesophilus TaxID=745119 RepID=UPI003D1CB771
MVYLYNQIVDISRIKIEEDINKGYVLVNEKIVKTKYLLNEKDIVLLSIEDIK